jgi:hypothetical protein
LPVVGGTAAGGTVMTGTAAVTMVALVRGIYSSVRWRSLEGWLLLTQFLVDGNGPCTTSQ